MQGIIEYSHHLMKKSLSPGDLAIDATCGNGNDTLVLSKFVGEKGAVLAFDIQPQAIETTKERLAQENRENVSLLLDSHANLKEHLDEDASIGGAIFNLGYLPRSDKTIITRGETTIEALQTILEHLKVRGIVALVVYHGHEGGQSEKEQLLQFVEHLDQKHFQVLRYEYINQKNNPPFVIAIRKIKER